MADPQAAKKAFVQAEAVAEGVVLARDLVILEPANMLGPIEFAERIEELKKLDVKVEILSERRYEKAGHGLAAWRRTGLRTSGASCYHGVARRQG